MQKERYHLREDKSTREMEARFFCTVMQCIDRKVVFEVATFLRGIAEMIIRYRPSN